MIWLLVIPALILAVLAAAFGRALIHAWARTARHAPDPELAQPSEADVTDWLGELREVPEPGKDIYTDHAVRLPWTPQVAERLATDTDVRNASAEDDTYDLCAGCRGHDHCDGDVEFCCCTCGWDEDEDWAEEHDEPAHAPGDDVFVSALLSLPVEDIDLAFATGQFPAVTA